MAYRLRASANMLLEGFITPSDKESPAVNTEIPRSQQYKKTRETASSLHKKYFSYLKKEKCSS